MTRHLSAYDNKPVLRPRGLLALVALGVIAALCGVWWVGAWTVGVTVWGWVF